MLPWIFVWGFHVPEKSHRLLVYFCFKTFRTTLQAFRLLEVYVFIYMFSFEYPGVWVLKGLLGQYAIVSSSGPLNSVGLVFEREGRCSTFHLQSRGAQCAFSFLSLDFQQLLLFFLLFQPLFVSLCCWKVLRATLTLGVFIERRRGWYPDVNVCLCLDSLKEYIYVPLFVPHIYADIHLPMRNVTS